ncbi:MAG: UDP-3-O-(3-hydroxymyristoyl)glucosamine N-acyltransferase [Thermodesulfobacteriota bacterium]
MLSYSLAELAHMLGGEASASPGPEIRGVRTIEHAGEADITYVTHPRYLAALGSSSASAVVLPQAMKGTVDLPSITVFNPEAAFARLTAVFYPYPEARAEISSRAEVHPEARLGAGVSVGAFSVVGPGAVIGDGTAIAEHVIVGEDVHIGPHCRIFPNVTIYPRVSIGARVVVHSGTVIGADGFGFARDADAQGRPVNLKKFHNGTVEIGDDVEIGALCAIDRALSGVTRLGNGVKIDNLVQVGHSVTVGDGTVIAGQSGIAGSSSIGRFGMVGGQVGIRDHVSIGDGVILATRVGIYRDVPDGSVMAGSVPAMPHRVFLRAQGLFKRLPEIVERLRKVEAILKSERSKS